MIATTTTVWIAWEFENCCPAPLNASISVEYYDETAEEWVEVVGLSAAGSTGNLFYDDLDLPANAEITLDVDWTNGEFCGILDTI